jgi:tRNA(His) 5'-end guanylyltransferase
MGWRNIFPENIYETRVSVMKFDELDEMMRVYETAHDYCVLPEIYMAARVDGRNFTKLTKERYSFEAPFDVRFRDYMIETTKHLMNCGFRVIYGYTESDEISLLFHPLENTFSRKLRKYESVLAGEASAKFSFLLGGMGVFDCRIAQLPTLGKVVDYFRWRNEDAHRNALNSHCYWMLRKIGLNENEATKKMKGLSISEKNEILFQNNVNFNELPNWQKRGVGLYFEEVEKKGYDPVKEKEAISRRCVIKVELELKMKEEYGVFIENLVKKYIEP